MNENFFDNPQFESIFAEAVKLNFEKEMNKAVKEVKNNPIQISNNHKEKMKKILKLQRKKPCVSWRKRIFIGLTVCFICLSMSLLFVPKIRAAVFEIFENIFGTHTQFSHSNDNYDTDINKYELTYIPQGYEQTEQSVFTDSILTIYSDNKGNMFTFEVTPATNSISVNNENIEYSTQFENNILYHKFISNNNTQNSSVVWENNSVTFYIGGNLSKEELMKIAQSVKEK